jgi:hypothetical protein
MEIVSCLCSVLWRGKAAALQKAVLRFNVDFQIVDFKKEIENFDFVWPNSDSPLHVIGAHSGVRYLCDSIVVLG